MQWGVHAMVDLPRSVLRITGSDRSKFLQDLVTNDVTGLDTGLVYAPDGAFADPRHPDMGWRAYDGRDHDTHDWAGLRVSLGLPEATRDLTPDSFILEMGFERFNGVDFRKGCYVGQEVTARMKHKTTLRKGLARVAIDGPAPVGSDIIVNEKAAGQLTSRVGDIGLAYLRFDRANQGNMMADTSKITLLDDC